MKTRLFLVQMKILVLALFVTLVPNTSFAQYFEFENDSSNKRTKADIGLGYGLDYGKYGLRATFSPVPVLELHIGSGYNLVGLGWNSGVSAVFNPNQHLIIGTQLNFGTNGEIYLPATPEFNKAYLGPSAGLSLAFHPGTSRSFWRVALLYPLRSNAFFQDMANYRTIQLPVGADPLPVSMSFGYHFRFH